MILVDTSVWIDHFRRADPALVGMLNDCRVLGHPFVTGELALGNLRNRDDILDALHGLPRANIATDDEVLLFILQGALSGRGIGYVDVHLLASVRLSPGSRCGPGASD